jgi:peptidyl-prolyl cis-trans isomerase SurA
MRTILPIRFGYALSTSALFAAAACALVSPAWSQSAAAPPAAAQSAAVQPAAVNPAGTPIVLDRVVAVVNKHPILASDVDDEIRLSILDENQVGQAPLTRERALEQLIGRTLIEQQIREGDAEAAEPKQPDVDARVSELRHELPACVRQNCATEAGWNQFLSVHGLTDRRVETYIRYRMEILSFIEQRFRSGIRISESEIEAYYNGTLLPQYVAGEQVPPLKEVAPRIEGILLEQQVNVLFDQWLENLRKQGDVEILDPALTPAPMPAAAEKTQ